MIPFALGMEFSARMYHFLSREKRGGEEKPQLVFSEGKNREWQVCSGELLKRVFHVVLHQTNSFSELFQHFWLVGDQVIMVSNTACIYVSLCSLFLTPNPMGPGEL